jgi:hypothetical protein
MLRIALILLFLSAAPAQTAESVYTELDRAKCRTVEYEHEGYSWTRECRGVAGYKLLHLQGDERESITVVSPDGRPHPLEFWSTVSPAFSSVGAKAEWRVRRRGDRVEPFALIVRLNANENPDQYQKITSYLVVARLAPGRVCVTDRIAPGPRANEQARQSADDSAAKPCLRPIGEEEPGKAVDKSSSQ